MGQLHTIQQQFWNSLRSHKNNPACAKLFTDAKLSQAERLDIYRNTMRTAHTNALAQTYRCCEKILGENYFKQIADRYFYHYPATSQNLNNYGQYLPIFMENWVQHHNECSDYPYLPDLTRLELACEQAYCAKDDPCFDFNSLATLRDDDQKKIGFSLSAALTVIESSYPVHEIWIANQGEHHDLVVNAINKPQYLCISREDFKPKIEKLRHASWWLLDKIQSNTTLEDLEHLAVQDKINGSLQEIIPELIRKKWICGYTLHADQA